jgi:hypothetical protein
MTNAIGGNIKVTLTLDDLGFTVKTRQAVTGIKGLNTELSGVTKAAAGLETKLGTLGKNLTLSSNNLKTLSASAKSLEAQFAAAGRSMASFNASSALASQNAELLNGAVLKLARLLDGAAANTDKAAASNRRLSTSQKAVAADSAAMVNGLTAQERAMRNLGETHRKTAEQVVLSASLRRNANARAAAEEIDSNNKLLQNKQRSLDSALKAEREFRSKLADERKREQTMQWRVDNKRDEGTGRILGANSPTLARYQAELAAQRAKVTSLQLGLNLLGQEAGRLTGNMNIINAQNTALGNRIGLEGRIEAALTRQKLRADEYLATQRAQAIKQREAIEMSKQQMDLIKGMSQLYAGSKIMQGEKSSVHKAGEFERTGVRSKAMGMTAEEQTQFNQMVNYDSKSHPGLNFNDAATARIGAMGGLATTNQRQINQTLPTAIDAAQNLQYVTGDEGQASFENLIRNLYGVAEARQVQYDPAKTKSTMEMLQKIVTATGNKIDIADVETLLRRVDPGNAAQLSNDGIINAVALMDQLKVSGGAGGGGAGGVSTLGTMIKMLQAYGNGKTMSNEMVKQFAEAGLLNTDSISSKNADGTVNATDASIKKFMGEAKKAGFNNVAKLNADPISAIRDMMKNVLTTISAPENRKKYFGDADVNDPDAQRNAISKWASRNGMTTTATGLLKTIADPRMQERIDHQHEMVNGAAGIDELKKLRMDTYEQSTKNFDAALDNLKVTLGTTVLPLMTSFFNWITKIVNKMQDFSQQNPMVAQVAMIGGAVGGLLLTLAGAAKMFGLVTGLGTLIRGAGVEAGAAAGKIGLFGRAFGLLSSLAMAPLTLLRGALSGLAGIMSGPILSASTTLAARFAAMGAGATGMRAVLATTMGTVSAFGGTLVGLGARMFGVGVSATLMAAVVGKAFLRMIPYVGWLLLAWDLTTLFLDWQVGFAKIGEWMDHWLAQLVNKFQIAFVKVRNAVRFTDDSNAEGDANMRGARQEEADENSRFERIRKRRKKQAEREARLGAKKDKGIAGMFGGTPDADLIAGKGFTHENPTATAGGAVVGGFEIPDAPGKKAPRAPRDQFARSLAEVSSKQEVTAMRITAQITGRADDLLEQARTEFFEKWKAGDFDPDHDANKRPFKGANGGLDWKAAGAGGSVDDWVNTRAAMLQQEEQLKALEFANQRVAAAREDSNTAMERGTNDTSKQTREMTGLVRELARAEERLKNGTKEFDAWNVKKNEALFERARADLVNYTADFKEGDRETQNSMEPNTRKRVGQQFDTKAQKDLETYNARLAEMAERYQKAVAGVSSLNLTESERVAQIGTLEKEFNEARTRAETNYTEHVKIQANARAYAQRGAIEKMQIDWENSFDKIDEVAANWGSGFVSQLSTWLTGGSVSIKEFVAGMLKDILDMKLKEALAKPMAGALDNLTGWLQNTLSNKAAPAGSQAIGAAGGATSGIMGSIGTGFTAAGNAVKGGINDAAKYFGLDKLAAMTDVTTDAVKGLATDGAKAATDGLVKTAAQTVISGTADMQAATSTGLFTLAIEAATAAMLTMAAAAAGGSTVKLIGGLAQMGLAAYGGSYGGASTATSGVTSGTGVGMGLGQQAAGPSNVFAMGGIMSSMGSLPLNAYANGGVANSPQLALFGEGRMNEAYVPLPDGRSIPVSFSGENVGGSNAGGGQTFAPVTISIVINKDGGETQSEDAGADAQQAKDLSNRIKTVVREVLLTETRPNGILDKRK